MVIMDHKILSPVAVAAPLVVVATQVLCCDAKTYTQLGICSDSHRQVLIDLKNGLNDPGNRLSSWTGSNCCQWEGIGCDESTGAVTTINLGLANLDSRYAFSGEISLSLVRLKSYLTHLDLSLNAFYDIAIPEFFGDLLNLQYLNLSYAGFCGKISSNLGNLSRLMYIDLSTTCGSSADNLEWFAGMVSLNHLSLNNVYLEKLGTSWVRVFNKLPSLTELHLSGCNLLGPIPVLDAINFTSLVVLDLSYNQFTFELPKWIANISSLVYVDMTSSGLNGSIPLGLGEIPNLKVLILSDNDDLSANCSQLFQGTWKSIEVLHLDAIDLHGKLLSSIGNMTFLTDLSLSNNNIEGEIPQTIGSLCSLVNFDLSDNRLSGTLPDNLVGTKNCISKRSLPNLMNLSLDSNRLSGHLPSWIGELKSLVRLQLGYNLIQGLIPASLGTLQNLTKLDLKANRLNGTLPTSLGQLKELYYLDVSFNHLTGMLTEEHFAKLSNVEFLDLSFNSFTLNVGSNWMPPFQVHSLGMASCYLGLSFPAWLEAQKRIEYLDMSSAGISGQIPKWFWDISSKLGVLNISMNNLQGRLPNPFNITLLASVDLSSNLFAGPVPLPIVEVASLVYSNNRFSGHIPQNISKVMPNLIFLSLSSNQLKGEIPKSIGEMQSLEIIDLSSNHLIGNIPPSLENCFNLKVLDLKNNSLSGLIPPSLGNLMELQSLHLSNNKLSGNIPPKLRHLYNLVTFDLGNNQLTSSIPLWLNDRFSQLRILVLRSNSFSGELPTNLSNLSSLQVLDLAENHLNGMIPASFGDFKAMLGEQGEYDPFDFGDDYISYYNYSESMVLNMKNQSLEYTKTLSLVISMDLSRNNLSGGFPDEITKLRGLLVLDLSRNHIIGRIPGSISHMRQLLSLDLSSNRLYGTIPPSMSSSLTYLSYFDVSNNNLSGRIPSTGQMTTFPSSSFSRNPGLCGDPLEIKCPGDDKGKNRGGKVEDDPTSIDDDDFMDGWFYLIVGVGFAAGILIPLLVLQLKKSWNDSYFVFIDRIVEKRLFTRNRK